MNDTSDEAPDRRRVPALLVFWAFLKLGLTSFGGPIAHLGYFQKEFVERRRWLGEAAYVELVALCQFLPGPASSQAGFVIGLRKAGAAGGLAAFAGFTLPSALLMFGAACGVALLDFGWLPALVHGLKLVAVSIVSHAVVAMARTQIRSLVAAAAAAAALAACLWGGPYAGPASIAIAAVLGLLLPVNAASPAQPSTGTPLASSFILLAIFFVLLLGLPLLRQLTADPLVDGGTASIVQAHSCSAAATSFYRSLRPKPLATSRTRISWLAMARPRRFPVRCRHSPSMPAPSLRLLRRTPLQASSP